MLSVIVTGLPQMLAKMASLPGQIDQAGAKALELELDTPRVDSLDLVPVESGLLASTAQVYPAQIRPGLVVAAIGYGEGGAEAYALLQHENMVFNHAPGRQAKYLEQPLLAWTRGAATRIGLITRGAIR